MDPDLRAIVIVVAGGTLLFGAGIGALYLAFRGFGRADAGRASHIAVMAGLIAFVLACCAVLFFLSYREM